MAWLAAVCVPAIADETAGRREMGKELFTRSAVPACALCHTLQEAGAQGTVGPVLDELKPDAERVAMALRNGIGQMPSYRATLSDEQIRALSDYVAGAAGAAP